MASTFSCPACDDLKKEIESISPEIFSCCARLLNLSLCKQDHPVPEILLGDAEEIPDLPKDPIGPRRGFDGCLGKLLRRKDLLETTREKYRNRGMGLFTPSEKQVLKSYYEVPVEIVEDDEELISWAQEAASRRAKGKGPARKKR